MSDMEILNNKRVLIVDDEPDILETLSELLDMCRIDTASDFETAEKLLADNPYDFAVLDIMGVRGYDLLKITNKKGIPAIMFTAHALSPDNFVKSIEGGARAYIPKEKMADIAAYVADLLRAHQAGIHTHQGWFDKLELFFEKQFGPNWLERYQEFRRQYNFFNDD